MQIKQLSPLLFLSFLIGCESGSCVTFTRAFINSSGKDVQILSYYSSEPPKFSKKFDLKNQGKIGDSYKDCPQGRATKEALNHFFEGDSIVIDFGDKIKGYGVESRHNDNRNPYYLYETDKSHDFTYNITPEDYANATPKQ